MADMSDMNELGGLSDGSEESGLGGLGGLSGDASMKARDAANMAGRDEMGMGFDSTPQSLGDFATQGMGEGLSAMKEGLGTETGGIELNAALQDEEEDTPIHAALQDEEEEAPIRAGRAEAEPIQAGYGQPQKAVGSTDSAAASERSSFDGYGLGGSDLANDPSQNIDDIFIAGSFNRSAGAGGGSSVSSTGGTMYDPSKDKPDVHVSFGLPPIIKKLLVFVCFIVVVLGVLKYGFHIQIENYIHPVDVQQYVDTDATTLGSTLGVKFKSDTERYQSSDYDYTYNVDAAGGLKLVNYDGTRLYIEVTGLRIDFSIYGIRPQITKYGDAATLLAAAGFTEEDMYAETEELGSEGEEHCFYNGNTGEGVIIGKKSQYQAVKAVKYVRDYKKFRKTRASLRGTE